MTENPNNHPTPHRHDGVFESERAGRTPPVTHNSGHIRTTPAGGEVSRDQYQRPVPIKNGGPAMTIKSEVVAITPTSTVDVLVIAS